MPYLQLPAASGDTDRWAPIRAVSRVAICGALFGAAFGIMAPASPGLRINQTADMTALIPRIMGDFFCVGFVSSAATYRLLVERRREEARLAKGAWLPLLGPFTALAPAFSCLVGAHLFYPGQWSLFCEPTWRLRWREFWRLNIKCFFAFAYYHLPPTLLCGILIGGVLYPYKRYRRGKLPAVDEGGKA